MKWTKDQEKAIFASPSSIVVSAAAGSGKTQVLTTRIIERIKNAHSPVSVENLLIVTFTKAAATEMKERIGKALRKAAKEETDKQISNFLKKQLALLGSAHICTIDSFCYDIVKQNFFKVNLPSDISIGEQGELSLLKLSALEETVNSLYCALEKSKGNTLTEENIKYALTAEKYFPDPGELKEILSGFEALTNSYSYDKHDSEFSENLRGGGDYTTMISELYHKSQSAAYPEKWLKSIADVYDVKETNYADTIVYKYAYETCKASILNAASSILQLAEVSELNNAGYEEFLRNEAQTLKEFASCKDYESLYNFYISTPLFLRISGKKTECDKELKSGITAMRTKIRSYLKDKVLGRLLQFSMQDCEALREQLYPQIKALSSAAILLGKIYYEKMTERRIIDFSTCEHLALEIISPDGITLTDVGKSIQNKFDEIYIDELQDSNDLQDILFSLISKGRSFMVGDVKQSIYGFRNADPTIFMKKCEESLFEEDAAKRKIILSKNFRSGKSVINGVNGIFDKIMTLPSSNIDYIKEHRLDFGTDFMPESVPDDKCELVVITQDGNSDNQKYNEAIYIAETIKELVNSQRLVWDKDEGVQRPIKFSDIAVLSRSLSSSSSIYESAFARGGVPCYVDGNNDLYQTVEIGQVLEILKLIDNAYNEISLACALRSPMFMFDENELLEIRLAGKESFCDAFYGICSSKYKVSEPLILKCRKFMDRLSSWRYASGFVSVEELIRRIYNDTSIYSSVLSFPDGQLRRANLDLLLEKAEEFERSTYTGLFNFVNYIEKIKKTADITSEARSVSEKMNVVRIMTIHKSKGLEFPVVFLAACGKSYRAGKAGPGGLIMNSHAGIGIDVVNPLLRCKYKSPIQSVLSDMEAKENAREEMRLLYVALTRAREKLYAIGTLSAFSKFEEYQYSLIKEPTANEILGANSYFALMALAFSRGADKYWNITSVIPEEKENDSVIEKNETEDFKENKTISLMLDFKYPYVNSVYLPNKASVTMLKSLDINLAPAEDGNIPLLNSPSCKKITLKKPEFGNKNKSGTFFGTAHHKVLQYIDYNGDTVLCQCEKLRNKGILTEAEFSVINIERIEEFLSSHLGEMIKESGKVYREEPFVINALASDIDISLPSDETICVQGIIDCYFEYNDSVVLVDYKTDYYDTPSEIVQKYQKQLYYYEKALRLKYKDKIIQKYLYLMHKNDIIKL